MRVLIASLLSATIALSGCASFNPEPAAEVVAVEEEKHPEARLYDASRDAKADVDAALLKAEAEDRLVMIVLGANWCHDSRAVAGWTETPRFQQLIADHYELVFVNVGMPQTKDGHNLDVAERFGIEMEGTPAVLIVSPLGQVMNADTAKTWRNAASRNEDAIFDELSGFTPA